MNRYETFKATQRYHEAIAELLNAVEQSILSYGDDENYLAQCCAHVMRAYVHLTGKEVR